MDHKNVKYVVGGGNYYSQVAELVDALGETLSRF